MHGEKFSSLERVSHRGFTSVYIVTEWPELNSGLWNYATSRHNECFRLEGNAYACAKQIATWHEVFANCKVEDFLSWLKCYHSPYREIPINKLDRNIKHNYNWITNILAKLMHCKKNRWYLLSDIYNLIRF